MHIKETSEFQHKALIKTMSAFLEDDKPQVGIFWYDYANNTLFGVLKGNADMYIDESSDGTYPKLHKTFWQKQHHRAVAKNNTESIFYKEHNYTKIPRGRIFVRPDNTFYVTVGDWIDGYIDGKKVIDADSLHELIEDEFNLPETFEFVKDRHWNLGNGWSEEKF